MRNHGIGRGVRSENGREPGLSAQLEVQVSGYCIAFGEAICRARACDFSERTATHA